MGDQRKITVLKKQMRDLESNRSELIEGRSQQMGRTLAEVDRELQSRGWFTFSSSPLLLPREYDPEYERQHLDDQITELGKALTGEEDEL
jgi:hypothetical protein